MKNYLKIILFIGIMLLAQTAYAAAITDTYKTGDTLTATTLDTIKNAVNDNNTRISGIKTFINTRAPTVNDDINDVNAYPAGSVWVDTSANTTYTLTDNTAGLAVWKQNTLPVTYVIGGTGPAGGWVFYVDATGQHGLEATLAAEEPDSGTIRWHNGASDTEAHSDGTGAGEMNTMLIIADQVGNPNFYAAGFAANVDVIHNSVKYGDWYLPSLFELDLMYDNIGRAGPNVGEFPAADYWSSSEVDANEAGFLSSAGVQGKKNKSITARVRAVRAF